MSAAAGAIDPGVPPSGTGCADRLAGDGPGWWFHLRRCAACGRIGCCDSSPSAHAGAHAALAGHPLIQSFEPGEDWFWSHADDEFHEGPRLPRRARPEDQPVPGPAGSVPPDWQAHLR